jgi:SAM-dependent methyltransferase
VTVSEALKAIKPVYASLRFSRYLLFQLELAFARLQDRTDGRNPAYAPIPPAELRHRVHGSLDAESFVQVGSVLAQNLRDLCAMVGRDVYSFHDVLDFGCGCGRVIRNFQDAPDSCQFYGTDIDAELVSWCEAHLPRVRWSTNGPRPPSTFPDGTFDLIFGISVFSHLDEELERAWLGELRRIAKPGATLILTVHGDSCIQTLTAPLRSRARSRGFMFVVGGTGRFRIDKLPDTYQTSYHTQEYVRREWSAYFEVVRYVERGINTLQDAVLLRKR